MIEIRPQESMLMMVTINNNQIESKPNISLSIMEFFYTDWKTVSLSTVDKGCGILVHVMILCQKNIL